MAIKTTLARSVLALALAATPMVVGMVGSADVAYAKGGNGGGHGGGSDHGKSSDSHDKGKGHQKSGKSERGQSHGVKATKTAKAEDDARAPGLRSLNRNVHAYMNSKDPRMAAVAAFAVAYAEFEVENGVDTVPTDPALDDEALRDALAGFAKDGVVTDAMVDEAKSVLGVGAEVGKIDQIREQLEASQPADDTDATE